MKKIYLALGLATGLSLSSCSLDTEPSTSLAENIALTSVSDLENAVNGIGYLLSEDRMTYGAEFAIYADLLTNEFAIANDYGQSSPIARYTIDKNHELVEYPYYLFYMAAANCNKALQLTADMEDENYAGEVDNLHGQLYAWRGLIHFDLARLFAHIPTTVSDVNAANSGIVLSTDVYEPTYKGARSTLKQTYDQIINDLTKAINLLDEDNGTGYFNYYAALAIRARAYLYMGEYDLALVDAKEVINSGAYRLYTIDNYQTVWAQEGTSESIFELLITDTHNAQRNAVGYYTDASGYPECAFNESGELYQYLLSTPEDVRSKLIKVQTLSNGNTYAFPTKYPGRGGLYVNNPKIIRLSELYLIAAEAELLGNTDAAAAASYINDIRRNRIEGYTDVASVTIDDIIFEYEKELFAENQIAFAYWRNKQSVTNQVGSVINYDNNRTIMPIPQREIDYDPTLVQNPGY